ncbi:hypothetical protein OSTOST_06569, partial [Ostertagia ostertagi]
MSGANSVVNVFQNLFSNHGSTFLNIILVVSTIGGQSIIRKLTFACPCSFPLNVYHSLVFMFGPAIALFIIGIVLNTTTWKILHGTCFSYYRCLLAHNYCPLNTSHHCVNITVLEYYKSSQEFEQNVWRREVLPALYMQPRWIDLHCSACVTRYTYVQRQYVETYKNEETNKFEWPTKEHAATLAERNARVAEINNPMFARLRLIAAEKTKDHNVYASSTMG